jgi:hypothetical protein
LKLLLLFTLTIYITPAFAFSPIDDLWHGLKRDFDSKPYFFNETINDQRNGIQSPFIETLFGEYAYNNGMPLTDVQLSNLPNGRFVDKTPFALAMAGRERLIKAGKIKDTSIMAIADFSKTSRERRFYVIDLKKRKVLINTWVSHASNSDEDNDGVPEKFSNVSGSKISSIGFMVTHEAYSGDYGLSRRLIGLDPLLNSNVLSRAIVIHGWGGMDPQQASYGNVSTSEGCLMFSKNESGLFWGMEDKSMLELVTNTLGSGAVVFTYSDVKDEQGGPLIFKSNWIAKKDLVDISINDWVEVPYEDEYGSDKELVSHEANPIIRNAKIPQQ